MPIPKIGQSLDIRLSEHSRDVYHSRLVEATSDHLFIDLPVHVKERTNAPASPTCWVGFNSADGAVCRFMATLLSTEQMPATVWRITKPRMSDVLRDQRREFVRVPADLPVRLKYSAESGIKHADVHTRDVSGGGLSILLPKAVFIRAGMMIDVNFSLPNGGFPVNLKCFVIRVGERNDFGIAHCSLQFIDIQEPIRQRIIQFVFWRQRKMT